MQKRVEPSSHHQLRDGRNAHRIKLDILVPKITTSAAELENIAPLYWYGRLLKMVNNDNDNSFVFNHNHNENFF
eukprot:COSAG02_NODE_17163_length_1024_cov_1.095135_2_plen_74_part_00